MKTFETPKPISVTVELGVGDLRVVASERTDTAVDVRPSDPSNRADVLAAEQTRVEYANGSLPGPCPEGVAEVESVGAWSRVDRRADRRPIGSSLSSQTACRGDGFHRAHRSVRVPDRGRQASASTSPPGRPQDRRRRRRRGPGRRDGRGHDRIRCHGHRERRRTCGREERQRRHVDRRGHRRGARERGKRHGLDRPGARSSAVAKAANGGVRLGGWSAAPWSRRVRSARSRWACGTAWPPGSTSTRSSAPCRTTWTRPSVPTRARTPSRCMPGRPTATSPSAVRSATAKGRNGA